MKRSWKDLGEVWSGRDLAVGEAVILNVFDKASNTLQEQIIYVAPDDRRAQYTWVQDFCRYINAQSALVHAGTENSSGDWEILNSGYRNRYWNLTSRELLVTTTVPSAWNWNSQRAIPLHATHSLPIGTRMRVNVRSATDKLLETFLVELDWFGMHQWPRDLAEQINASSRLVRAGRADGERIVPDTGATANAIWLPHNGNFKVSWFAETVSVDAEDDAGQGAQQPLLVFDYNADRLVEGAVVQQDVAGAERCKAYVLDDASEEVLDETEVVPTQDLKAKDRVKVNISTRGQGRICETLTFTPVVNRLKAGQWHHDLALQINAQSRYVKAWAEDELSKTAGKGNVFWLPIWPSQELQVGMQVVASSSAAQPVAVADKKDEVALVGSDKCSVLWPCEPGRRTFTTAMSANNWVKGPALDSVDLAVNEQIVIRVKGSKTGRILESLVFLPELGRLDLRTWTEDLCSQVNDQCKFLRAGECNAKTFVIAASGSKGANFFWTPAGSGLVVEAEILSGFTFAGHGRLPTPSADAEEELPGMISEDRRLFDQYAEAGRLISIDALSGLPTLNISVAELYADDSLSQPLKVAFSFQEGVFLGFGGASRYVAMPGGKFSNDFILCLRDGRKVKVEIGMEDDINGGDFTISPIREEYSGEMQCVGFKVTYKDGGSDDFRLISRTDKGGVLPLSRYSISSGSELDITTTFANNSSGELKVTKSSETLLEAKLSNLLKDGVAQEDGGRLEKVVLYPKSSSEKVTWNLTRPDKTTVNIEADGLGVNGKVLYCITADSSNRLISVEMKQQYSFTEDEKTTTDESIRKETLEYDDKGKVKLHEISPGGDMDVLVHEYTYSETGSVLTGFFSTATPKTVFTRTHSFSDGQSSEETYGSTKVPFSRTQTHTLDETKQCVVTSTKVCEGEVTVDEQTLTVDAIGNPQSRCENDQTTYYTYYNNYMQYEVIENEERVQNTSFFGWLLKPLDYINPVGWACLIGGVGGFTWGTYLKVKVDMQPTKNDYARKAFDLPVDIIHCGSAGAFSGDMESELVTRKIDGTEQAQRLTFFGYDKIDKDSDKIRLKKKLTVLQPDYERIDVQPEQLACATAAAQKFITSMKEQIAKASEKEKKVYQDSLTAMEKSLEAQSKVNRYGYKLKSKQGASMTLETFEYHTDSSKAGYGTVKSIVMVLLDKDGKEVEASRRTTTMDYSAVDDDATRVVIKTTVTGSDKTELVSSQTRSRHTGRLLESLDAEGIKTVYTYDPQGNLTSETVSKDDTERRKTTVSLVRKLVRQSELVEGDMSSRLDTDALGRRVAMWVKPKDATDFLETQRWTYDNCGRTLSSVEIDYGAENKKISQRQTRWSYDSTSGELSIDNILKTGTGGWLKNTKQSITPAVKGELFTQGKFSIDRQFDPATNTLTEHYATTGSGGCKIERSLSADGILKSVRYLTVDKDGTPTEHDKITYTHDAHGQISKVTPTLGGESVYTYDSAGRLLTTERDGVILSNTYSASSLAPVALYGDITQGQVMLGDVAEVEASKFLGMQTVDMLGRVVSQTFNGSIIEYSYSGGSRVSTLKSPGTAPTKLEGYSSTDDQATRTQTQTITRNKVDYSSTVVFSSGGRVVSFTDLTKATTTYQYDFFNRVVLSENDHCESSCTYADNGLLKEESIKALKAGNLTMKVTYSYDELGQETSRTFTCDGVPTLTLERTLRGDGRLSSTCVKEITTVNGKKSESTLGTDKYTYDDALRLTFWESDYDECRFEYDLLGNLLLAHDQAFYYNSDDLELVESAMPSFRDDSRIENHSCQTTHDVAGRLTSRPGQNWTYHGNGQLATGGGTYTFSYDSEGRVRGGSTSTLTDTYHYRGNCVYASLEEDSTGDSGFSKRILVLRNDSRGCLMQDVLVDDKDDLTTRSFLLRDACGSVVATVDLSTKKITHCGYTPYGQQAGDSNAVKLLSWKGEPFNRMGLYYLGNGTRAYDPEWGRFLTRDTLSPFAAGGAASYVFGLADPINHNDPSGHQIVAQYERWTAMPFVQTTAFRVVLGALGVVLAPFTSGMSALMAVATTSLAAVSFSFDMASLILSESDPALAKTLETWGQAFAIVGAATGLAMMAHGWKGFPKKLFDVRGYVRPAASRFLRTPASELVLAHQAKVRAVNGFIRGVEEAKAAGTFNAFKARYVLPESAVGASSASSAAGQLGGGAGNTAKNLFTGTIGMVDDSMMDILGMVVSLHTLAQPLVANFVKTPPGATTTVSIVGGPLPGREKLFP